MLEFWQYALLAYRAISARPPARAARCATHANQAGLPAEVASPPEKIVAFLQHKRPDTAITNRHLTYVNLDTGTLIKLCMHSSLWSSGNDARMGIQPGFQQVGVSGGQVDVLRRQ